MDRPGPVRGAVPADRVAGHLLRPARRSPQRVGNQLAAAPAAVINTFQTATTVDHRHVRDSSIVARSPLSSASPPEDYATRPTRCATREARPAGRRVDLPSSLAECLETMQQSRGRCVPHLYGRGHPADDTYRERENIMTVEDPDLGKSGCRTSSPSWQITPARSGDGSRVGRGQRLRLWRPPRHARRAHHAAVRRGNGVDGEKRNGASSPSLGRRRLES